MRAILAHIWRNRWLYMRLMPVCAVLFDPGPEGVGVGTIHSFLPILLFIIGTPILLFFWIIAGPDDAGHYSLNEILFTAPMLPISRSWCVIWTYLGNLTLAMTLSLALRNPGKVWPEIIIDFAFAGAILLGAISAYYIQRNRLTSPRLPRDS